MQRATPSRILVFVPSTILKARRAVKLNPILRLQAAVWNDKARVGHIRTIRLGLALGIRAILSGRGLDNSLPERSEQKRDHERGPDGIDGRRLMALRRVQNQVSRQGRSDGVARRRRRPSAGRSLLRRSRRPNRRRAWCAEVRARSPGSGSGLAGHSSRRACWAPRTNAVTLARRVAWPVR
jgi:hypothetical protein